MSPTFKALAALSLYLLCAQTFAQSRQADAALCGSGQGADAFQDCLRLADADARGSKKGEDKRLPVDLNNPKDVHLDSVALVGLSTEDWTKTGWGSGSLVSKCHVLTSHHAVFAHGKTEKGTIDPKKEEKMYLGKEVLVGLGQISGSPWKSDRIIGKIVGFDETIRNLDQSNNPYYDDGKDFAVIKLNKGKDGKYPGEKRKPFCLQSAFDKVHKNKNLRKLSLRGIGHPGDKYFTTPKGEISLWQDIDCRIIGTDGSAFRTNCQSKGGMSGGPLTQYDEIEDCWTIYAMYSGGNTMTEGLMKRDETDLSVANIATPISPENRLFIEQIMKENPCD